MLADVAVPNAVAALLLYLRDRSGQVPQAYFHWGERNPLLYLIRYVLSGQGDVAPITREILRQADAEEHLASRDLRRALEGAIQTLPSEQQAVVRLTFFQQLSQRQLAARTGLPIGTIKTRLELAMSKLHKR